MTNKLWMYMMVAWTYEKVSEIKMDSDQVFMIVIHG